MDDHAAPPRHAAFPAHSRLRSQGPLPPDSLAACRAQGIALVYDPVQIGWLTADCVDDLDHEAAPPPRTEPLSFRPWQAQDLDDYHAMLDDPAVWQFLPESRPTPLSRDDAAALLALSNDAPHHEVRAVLVQGRPVGQVRLVLADGEVSYWLGRAHWGRGIARRALADWTAECRARHPGLSLYARIRADHAASRKVAEAAGYRDAGYENTGAYPAAPAFRIFRLAAR